MTRAEAGLAIRTIKQQLSTTPADYHRLEQATP